ncbi:hypothetical protein OIV83_005020 [Microbotryomycetes sp. JL201]|nr:hypothetical protein OIV83_005020 [Microbotryomycetes sp. JL201]
MSGGFPYTGAAAASIHNSMYVRPPTPKPSAPSAQSHRPATDGASLLSGATAASHQHLGTGSIFEDPRSVGVLAKEVKDVAHKARSAVRNLLPTPGRRNSGIHQESSTRASLPHTLPPVDAGAAGLLDSFSSALDHGNPRHSHDGSRPRSAPQHSLSIHFPQSRSRWQRVQVLSRL